VAKRALILGISGQDGAFLAKRLLDDGYAIHGSSRDRELVNLSNLRRLGIASRIDLHTIVLTDFRSVLQGVAAAQPDEIYNLAGQSSVGLSFETPTETLDGIIIGTVNILEAMRFLQSHARFFNAASSESFGDVTGAPANEATAFRPRSPYGVAKAAAFWVVRNYREAYGLFACSGILFNHESSLRPARFVTRKIVRAAVEIASGRSSQLKLGNLEISRDWGWAPEYVHAMQRMLAADEPEDLVIATGKDATLRDFVSRAFARLDLDADAHVRSDPALQRPLDLSRSVGDPSRIAERLGWRAAVTMPELVDRLVDEELAREGKPYA
jgi:GDPmannose 4,6-dehydratase